MKRWVGRHASKMSEKVRATYGETCWLCGRPIPPGEFSVDHVIPRSKSSPDLWFAIENLRPAHMQCNRRRGNRDASTVRPIPRSSRRW